MKNLLYCATMFLVMIVVPLSASAQFPKSQSPVSAPVQVSPQPVVTAAPSAATPAPAADNFNMFAWIWTALAGLFTGLQGYGVLFKPNGGATTVAPPQGVTDLLKAVKDPATRQSLDQHLLEVISSGVLRGPVQAGLGMVPVAGPALSGLEPIVASLVAKQLAGRANQNVPS